MKNLQIIEIPTEPQSVPFLTRNQYSAYRKVDEAMQTVARIEELQATNYQVFGENPQSWIEADQILIRNAHEVLERYTGNPRGFLPESQGASGWI